MKWRQVAQLALVHVGVSITVVPVTGTLNRIMIADLGWSALGSSLLVALPSLLSPLQVGVGSWADRHPLGGRHRTPWIALGGVMAAFGSYFTSHAVYYAAEGAPLGLAVALAVFLLWGIGVNIASVSYLSLLTELSAGQRGWRTRAVSIMWTAMILGTIATSISLAALLDPFDTEALFTSFGLVWFVACLLVLLGVRNLEPPRDGKVQHSADDPIQAYHVLVANPSARRFFVYLFVVLVSIHAQDVLLEPYGGEVLAMPVSATTRLSSIWGTGFLITLISGLPLVNHWGKKPAANWGAAATALAFCAIIATGLLGSTPGFLASVFALGLGGGLMTVSNLSFMLDMTLSGAEGLYMGAWGVANFAGQALGAISSGLLRDVVLHYTALPSLGYISVFGLEVIGLVIAIALFRAISVEEFQRDAQRQMAKLATLAGD